MAASYRLGAGAVLGLAICMCALFRSELVTAILCVLCIGAMSWAWLGRIEIPSRKSSVAVITVVGFAAAAVQMYANVDNMASYLALVGAAGVLLAFLTQMLRTTRERITESIASTITGLTIALFIPGWVLAMRHPSVVIACAVALGANLLLTALPLYRGVRFLLNVVGGAAVAYFVPPLLHGGTPNWSLAGMGAAIGIAVHTTNEVLGNMKEHSPLPLPTGASSPEVIEALQARQPKPATFPQALALSAAQAGVASLLVFIAAFTLA